MISGTTSKEIGLLGGKRKAQDILVGTYTASEVTEMHTIYILGILYNSKILIEAGPIDITVSC